MAEQKKALIAMSGGVDSSVAAHLMQEAGYICYGVTMRLHDAKRGEQPCQDRDIEDARRVCQHFGMDFHVLDLRQDFCRAVMEPFVQAYEAGYTPNPCVLCNRSMKFAQLSALARRLGCSRLVTGHYAQVHWRPEKGRYMVARARQARKDQSYVLYSLPQEDLALCHFPLGSYDKEEIRKLARSLGLENAERADSQDICFIPDGDYRRFIEDYRGHSGQPGEICDLEGRVLGQHNGALGFTIGQRKGLNVACGERSYVLGKDMGRGRVYIGREEELYARYCLLDQVNCQESPTFARLRSCQGRSRYHAPLADLNWRAWSQGQELDPVLQELLGEERSSQDRVLVRFTEAQRALTPGQSLVFYEGDWVLGGGRIARVFKGQNLEQRLEDLWN